jgi:hypothetical protein
MRLFSNKSRWQPLRIPLEGTSHLIGLNNDNLIYLLLAPTVWETRLACYDLSGRRLWQRDLGENQRRPLYFSPLRVAQSGEVWLAHEDFLQCFGPNSEEQQCHSVSLAPNEHIGSFLLGQDCFYINTHKFTYASDDYQPRALCLNLDASLRWSTPLPISRIAYRGCMQMRAATGWKSEETPAWRPRSWRSDHYVRDNLLLSGNRLLTNYIEISSGIGISYCVDADTGQFLWQTDPGPYGYRATVGNGQFVIGMGGYGAADTFLYDGNGKCLKHWPCEGQYLLTPSGEIRVIEFQHGPRLKTLLPDGTVRQGPILQGNHTARPALSGDGRMVFYREGQLIAADEQLRCQTLFSESEYRAAGSRILLNADGTLIFTVNTEYTPQSPLKGELWIVPTDLAPLAATPWPCGEGNLRANPAYP